VTPLLTQITFEGLIDEVVGIKHGAVALGGGEGCFLGRGGLSRRGLGWVWVWGGLDSTIGRFHALAKTGQHFTHDHNTHVTTTTTPNPNQAPAPQQTLAEQPPAAARGARGQRGAPHCSTAATRFMQSSGTCLITPRASGECARSCASAAFRAALRAVVATRVLLPDGQSPAILSFTPSQPDQLPAFWIAPSTHTHTQREPPKPQTSTRKPQYPQKTSPPASPTLTFEPQPQNTPPPSLTHTTPQTPTPTPTHPSLTQYAREARRDYGELGSKDLTELKSFVKGLPRLLLLDRLSDLLVPVAEVRG